MPGMGFPVVISSTISANVFGYGASPLLEEGATSAGACETPVGSMVVLERGASLGESVCRVAFEFSAGFWGGLVCAVDLEDKYAL
jgi:hypothetical protein